MKPIERSCKVMLLALLLLFAVSMLFSCSSKDKGITVFEDGKTEYTIVVEEYSSKEIMAAAEELSELSGGALEIQTESSDDGSLEIFFGYRDNAIVDEYVEMLEEAVSVEAFNYIIAENGGNIIILSDDDTGYSYALEYIKEACIKNGRFSVKEQISVMQRVSWVEYYNSDVYLDILMAEADKYRCEEGKHYMLNELGKYDIEKEGSAVSDELAAEHYRELLAGFDIADFGEYHPSEFTSKNTYRAPSFHPGASHPRVMFTAESVGSVRDNLEATQNSAAYKKYIALSKLPCDGKFKTRTENMAENYSADITSIIEAKAFRYAMTGEKAYGYEAIYASKNAILTIDVPLTIGDACRSYGHLMYVVSCVYDWCYDLMSEEDKTQLLYGCVNILGKAQEVVRYVGSDNKAPTGLAVAFNHGGEDQLLVDYLAFAIACYDEAPEIYELVAGRILNDYAEAQSYMFESGSYGEGSMYSFVRGAATVVSNILFNKMTNGEQTPFKNVEEIFITGTHYLRPDGQMFRIGDINENKTMQTFQFVWFANCCFYAGNLYENEYLKSYSYKYLESFTSFSPMVAGLSCIQFLSVNDPKVSHICEEERSLTHETGLVGWPDRSLFARSANSDDAFALYMTMPDYFIASHQHMECGSFQIFYKGILASDSGAYSSWGGTHHFGYHVQSIATNSLLIYNPNLQGSFNDYRTSMIYTGSQSIKDCTRYPNVLDEIKEYPTVKNSWCTPLGTVNAERDGVYLYSYMGGDMTGAYDSETVDAVARYMFAVATGDESCPLVFLTFDRVTTDSIKYHKAALIHTQEEPTVTQDGFVIITNTKGQNNGKMIVQTVGYETEYAVIGGEGREYWIPGVSGGEYSLEAGYNLPHNYNLIAGSIAEYGWGRIEISPKSPDRTNYMLTVMYVTDADNNSAPIKAKNISSERLSGAEIFGKAVLFPEAENLLTGEASFTLTEAGECFVAGVLAGGWDIMYGGEVIATAEVKDGENLLTFSASAAGTYTLRPAS